jgi:hypothetical protein
MTLGLIRGCANPRAIVRLEGLRKMKEKSNNLIVNRTRDIAACSLVRQLRYIVPHV